MELPSALWSTDVLMALLFMLAIPFLYNLSTFLHLMWLTPHRIARIFKSQGIPCIPYRLMYGNLLELTAIQTEAQSQPLPNISHDFIPYALPFFHRWTEKYGSRFVYWQGPQARFFLTDPEDIKEVLTTKFVNFVRLLRRPDMVNLIDNGLLQLEGERWAFHRRILNPGFFPEKLKAMVPTMAKCTMEMIEMWNSRMGKSQLELDVSVELRALTADIIAHTAFGSSYAEGKQIFELQQEQLRIAPRIARSLYIPGVRLLPTPFNRHCWKIEKRIEELTCQMIEKRLELSKVVCRDMHGNDLLGLMIDGMKKECSGNGKSLTMGIADIVGECKTFFLAGYETTATLLSWTFLLLAEHPEWQERVREEVQTVYGASGLPTADSIYQLKLVGMVLNESLRLYPPAAVMMRRAVADMQLGKLMIPKDTVLMLPMIALHHDERYWGPDAKEFHPERFSDGAAKACRVAGTFMPFSIGPQVCIGQAFALLEAKVVIAAVLQRYRIRVSAGYKHSPVFYLTLQPQYGIPLAFEKI